MEERHTQQEPEVKRQTAEESMEPVTAKLKTVEPQAEKPAGKRPYRLIGGIVLILLLLGVLIGLLVLKLGKEPEKPTSDAVPTQTTENDQSGEEETKEPSSALTSTVVEPGKDENEGTGNETPGEETAAPTGMVTAGGHLLDTGNLRADASQYEGTKGTGEFNYGEALQKSLLFYELQRSGRLPEKVRCNWRGDSALTDGSEVGLDLTGGWYDAGDHVKFNLPMSYTAAMLAWSLYEDYDAYKESGQLTYMLDNLRWANEYFIRCHPEKYVYYYQVGSGSADHSWWGPAEVMDMSRPVYKVDKQNPGSCVVAETAASLAACSIAFAKEDPEFSKECLKHAEELYAFADETRSDAGYTAANGFYNSWSGFWDELAWSATWLYLATDDKDYLQKAEAAAGNAKADYDWAHCWDNVYYGTCLLLARETGKETYISEIEKHLDVWTVGADGLKVSYTPKGLAYIDGWGALRYSTTTAFLAAVYSTWKDCPKDKQERYWDFAVSQVNYALGSTGMSYMIGFGDNYPQHPHHRTAQGSYCNNMNEPSSHRHILFGALVGGPNANDAFDDTVSNYQTNEVACDYNAGFTGALAKLYSVYKGQTLVDFGAVEDVTEDELSVEASVNVKGQDFVEIRAFVMNRTGWPARVTDKLELRYFMDLSELYAAGGDASALTLTGNYMQGGSIGGIYVWDEEKHIYYASIDFTGTDIRPAAQDAYKREVQFRILNQGGVWDNENDPSYADLTGSGQVKAYHMALYDDGKLCFGTEPPKGEHAGTQVTHDPAAQGGQNQNGQGQNDQNQNGQNQSGQNQNGQSQNGTAGKPITGDMIAESKSLRVENTAANSQSEGGTIPVSLVITNTSDGYLKLSELTVEYYFTKDGSQGLNCFVDYSGVSSSDGYFSMDGITGAFKEVYGKNSDTCCVLANLSDQGLAKDGTWTINARITKEDWSNFRLDNDYSASEASHIVVRYEGTIIFGTQP